MNGYSTEREGNLVAAEPVELIDEGDPDAGYLRQAAKHLSRGAWWNRLLRRRKPTYPKTFGT